MVYKLWLEQRSVNSSPGHPIVLDVIPHPGVQIGKLQAAICNLPYTNCNLQTAICYAICKLYCALKSAYRNLQKVVCNLQTVICKLKTTIWEILPSQNINMLKNYFLGTDGRIDLKPQDTNSSLAIQKLGKFPDSASH